MTEDEPEETDQLDLSGRRESVHQARLGEPGDHRHLHAVCIHMPTDFEPYGYRVRAGPDCSCGCKWFLPLQVLPSDWGVCSNPESPRCGLLTFEHQGCACFTAESLPDEGEPV